MLPKGQNIFLYSYILIWPEFSIEILPLLVAKKVEFLSRKNCCKILFKLLTYNHQDGSQDILQDSLIWGQDFRSRGAPPLPPEAVILFLNWPLSKFSKIDGAWKWTPPLMRALARIAKMDDILKRTMTPLLNNDYSCYQRHKEYPISQDIWTSVKFPWYPIYL